MGTESVNFKPEKYKTQSGGNIMSAMQGNQPSQASALMSSGLARALANAGSMAATNTSVNPALANYQAQQAGGRMSAEMVPQQAALRAQEMANARAQALSFDQMQQQALAQQNQMMLQKALSEYQKGPMWQQMLGQGLQAAGAVGGMMSGGVV